MKPQVSIITVNYNGKKYLKDFLDSVTTLDYPKDRYEVIVVDNASTDDSVNFIKKNYPDVDIVKSTKNLGFGGANNLGIKVSSGELVVLLNNDTVVGSEFLTNIVSCFKNQEKKQRVGAMNAKIVLIDKYIPINLKGASYVKYSTSNKASPKNPKPFIVSQLSKEYTQELLVPYNFEYDENDLKLSLYIKNEGGNNFKIKLKNKVIKKGKFNKKEESKLVEITLDKKIYEKISVDLIQNSGTIIFKDGFGRDRGAVIIEGEQHYETDQGQYNKVEKVNAFCGAAVILNKDALEDVGYFDDDFFMYYEDVELSLRIKENGWKVLYCPKAVVRHIHSASSKEGSPFFMFQVEKNRLLLLAKHWPRSKALKEWAKYLVFSTFGSFLYYLIGRSASREYLNRFILRLKVNASLMVPFFRSLFRSQRLTKTEIKKFV